MKQQTLYVSDLDGTLLRKNERLSAYTNEVINRMTKQGMLFSYATARSIVTAKKVTAGLEAKIPLIVYNGAFIIDNQTGELLAANYFEGSVKALIKDLLAHDVYPIVYAMLEGAERFSYWAEKCSRGMLDFIATRNDSRKRPVRSEEELGAGRCFYISCIESEAKLKPLYEKYQEQYHCVYHKDIYSGEQWLEIMPKQTTKAHAICQLKQLLNCSRVIAFGDGLNDREMFQIADESYAVANAAEALKQLATGVIGSNEEDGVAHWLEENA